MIKDIKLKLLQEGTPWRDQLIKIYHHKCNAKRNFKRSPVSFGKKKSSKHGHDSAAASMIQKYWRPIPTPIDGKSQNSYKDSVETKAETKTFVLVTYSDMFRMHLGVPQRPRLQVILIIFKEQRYPFLCVWGVKKWRIMVWCPFCFSSTTINYEYWMSTLIDV